MQKGETPPEPSQPRVGCPQGRQRIPLAPRPDYFEFQPPQKAKVEKIKRERASAPRAIGLKKKKKGKSAPGEQGGQCLNSARTSSGGQDPREGARPQAEGPQNPNLWQLLPGAAPWAGTG